MRFEINLASQPYQDVQRFLFRWRMGLLALALLTGGLLYAAGTAYLSWRVTDQQIGYLRQQIAERDRQKAAVEAFLNQAENRTTRDRSLFLNSLIARKAFSWTEVFSDLEKVMPARLRVLSITPSINENNQLELRLMVAGPSRDNAIELVRRLERSAHFTAPRVDAEQAKPASTTEPASVNFQISAIYLPSFARPQPATSEAVARSESGRSAKQQPGKKAATTEARNAGH